MNGATARGSRRLDSCQANLAEPPADIAASLSCRPRAPVLIENGSERTEPQMHTAAQTESRRVKKNL